VSVWWKTLQRSVNPAVRKLLTPQQLGVAVMSGTQIKVIGAALKIEEARKKSSPYAHVALDLKNAHNEFSRRACEDSLDEAARADDSLLPLARAHHSTCGQPNPIFMRAFNSDRGLAHLCDGGGAGGPGGPRKICPYRS
jgi:hypothetical protein